MNVSEFEDAYDEVIERGDNTQALLDRIQRAGLETPVSELMATTPVCVEADATVVAAVQAMNEHHTGCVVVQKEGKLVGIFTERDVLRKVIFRDKERTLKVYSVMTRNPTTLPPTATVAYALNKMSVDGYRHIPIVDDAGRAIGVLSIKDIVQMLVEWFPESVLNLPADPAKAHPRSEDGG